MKTSKVSKFALYSQRNKHHLGIFTISELGWNGDFFSRKKLELWVLGKGSLCLHRGIIRQTWKIIQLHVLLGDSKDFSAAPALISSPFKHSLLIYHRWMIEIKGFPPFLFHHWPLQKSFWVWCNSKMCLMTLITTSNRIRAGQLKPPRRKWCLARLSIAKFRYVDWYYLNNRFCKKPRPRQA